jgi:hypothetical protein
MEIPPSFQKTCTALNAVNQSPLGVDRHTKVPTPNCAMRQAELRPSPPTDNAFHHWNRVSCTAASESPKSPVVRPKQGRLGILFLPAMRAATLVPGIHGGPRCMPGSVYRPQMRDGEACLSRRGSASTAPLGPLPGSVYHKGNTLQHQLVVGR